MCDALRPIPARNEGCGDARSTAGTSGGKERAGVEDGLGPGPAGQAASLSLTEHLLFWGAGRWNSPFRSACPQSGMLAVSCAGGTGWARGQAAGPRPMAPEKACRPWWWSPDGLCKMKKRGLRDQWVVRAPHGSRPPRAVSWKMTSCLSY